eukprot:GFYU01033805.1.p1 GENE.GFYU01033805.1~~GFYU01033805.1.p1  ORF type:complete len:414 (-),score=87.91 GFYU01033805.1:77-1255(-)
MLEAQYTEELGSLRLQLREECDFRTSLQQSYSDLQQKHNEDMVTNAKVISKLTRQLTMVKLRDREDVEKNMTILAQQQLSHASAPHIGALGKSHTVHGLVGTTPESDHTHDNIHVEALAPILEPRDVTPSKHASTSSTASISSMASSDREGRYRRSLSANDISTKTPSRLSSGSNGIGASPRVSSVHTASVPAHVAASLSRHQLPTTPTSATRVPPGPPRPGVLLHSHSAAGGLNTPLSQHRMRAVTAGPTVFQRPTPGVRNMSQLLHDILPGTNAVQAPISPSSLAIGGPSEVVKPPPVHWNISRRYYAYEELINLPREYFPKDMDLSKKEMYLHPEEFPKVFDGMSYEQFIEQPLWKQVRMKKERKLFAWDDLLPERQPSNSDMANSTSR